MKRMLVVCMVVLSVFFVGAAFAAESFDNADVNVPNITTVQNSVSGGTVDSVAGFTATDAAALRTALESAGYDPRDINSINWSKVVVTLSEGNTFITVFLDDTEITVMRNSSGTFERVYGESIAQSEGPAKGVTTALKVEKGGKYDLTDEAGKVAYDVAKLEFVFLDSGSSGCSAMTFGAIALFLAPMGAMLVRRGKK